MDTFSHRNTFSTGRLVLMDELVWSVDRETPTSGVYRLLLVEEAPEAWPVGQVGFGHHTRLVPVELCPDCDSHRTGPRERVYGGGEYACRCGHSGPVDELTTHNLEVVG